MPHIPLGYHPDLIVFSLYGSHMCDHAIEKYMFNLLDQSLLSSKPYASDMSTTTMLMHWWNRLLWYSHMITSRSSAMGGIDVRSSWMICADVFLHYALIFLAMESGMILATKLESTKQLWPLQLKNSNERRNRGNLRLLIPTRLCLAQWKLIRKVCLFPCW